MMSSITICSQRSGSLEVGAYAVTNAIKSYTTPQEFDSIIAENHGYALEHGGRCGWNALGSAACISNATLVRHIVQRGGTHLLHLGNTFGWTPLHCAASCENMEN